MTINIDEMIGRIEEEEKSIPEVEEVIGLMDEKIKKYGGILKFHGRINFTFQYGDNKRYLFNDKCVNEAILEYLKKNPNWKIEVKRVEKSTPKFLKNDYSVTIDKK